MEKTLNVCYQEKPCYDIVYSKDFSDLADEIKKIGFENRKICLITDSNVDGLYSNEVCDILNKVAKTEPWKESVIISFAFLIKYKNSRGPEWLYS